MDRKEGFEMDGIGEDLLPLSNGHFSCILQCFSKKRLPFQ
jgi:hypothetical protein